MPLRISSYLNNSPLTFLHVLARVYILIHPSKRFYNPALPCRVYNTEVSRDQTQGNDSLQMIVIHTSNVLSTRWVTQSSKAEPTTGEIENLSRISARPQYIKSVLKLQKQVIKNRRLPLNRASDMVWEALGQLRQ